LEESQLSSNLAFRDRAYRRGTKSKYVLNFLPKKNSNASFQKKREKPKEKENRAEETHIFF